DADQCAIPAYYRTRSNLSRSSFAGEIARYGRAKLSSISGSAGGYAISDRRAFLRQRRYVGRAQPHATTGYSTGRPAAVYSCLRVRSSAGRLSVSNFQPFRNLNERINSCQPRSAWLITGCYLSRLSFSRPASVLDEYRSVPAVARNEDCLGSVFDWKCTGFRSDDQLPNS